MAKAVAYRNDGLPGSIVSEMTEEIADGYEFARQDHQRTGSSFRQRAGHGGRHAVHPGQQSRAGSRPHLRQGRGVQSGLVGQGPVGAQHHRSRGAQRHAEARPDGGRGHQWQHGDRPGHGVRAEGIPAGGDDGRQFFDRTPQADADVRREGRADAARPEGPGDVPAKPSNWRRRTAGFSRVSSRRRPMPTSTSPPRRARSSATSKASASTISSAATAPGAR